MDASSLEKEIANLEASSESLEAWLALWITLVVLGLVVEVAVVLTEFFHVSSYDAGKRNGWKLFQNLLGPILITIGVAGELGIHVKAGHINTSLRNASRSVSALLNKEAGYARREAALARKEAESARRDAEGFRLDIVKTNGRAAEAVKIAEQERLARIKIEHQLSDRDLSAAERVALLQQARQLKIRARLIFNSTIGSREAKRYADQIAKVLSEGKLQVMFSTANMGNAQLTGVWVGASSRAAKDVTDAAVSVLAALRGAGLQNVNMLNNTNLPVIDLTAPMSLEAVEILVGGKPMGP
ncbi:MAG TPA: hypothetical protein VMZ30_09830 [Pyrinomonadaceae bacterium]|nr:hypothetical protein [Pyrinomonadaceae bacterium]